MKALVLFAALSTQLLPNAGFPEAVNDTFSLSSDFPTRLVTFVYINKQMQDGEPWGFPVEVFDNEHECLERAKYLKSNTHLTLRTYCTIEHTD